MARAAPPRDDALRDVSSKTRTMTRARGAEPRPKRRRAALGGAFHGVVVGHSAEVGERAAHTGQREPAV